MGSNCNCLGDVIFFHGLGNNVLVLNTLEAVSDLLDKRGSIYSHRPSLVVGGELMRFDRTTGMLPYEDEWKARRKLGHTGFSQAAVKKYHGVQEDMAALLNKAILENPDEFFELVKLSVLLRQSISGSLIFRTLQDCWTHYFVYNIRLIS